MDTRTNPTPTGNAPASKADRVVAPTQSTSGRNLLETASATQSFATFRKAVETAGLGATFRGAGPFTVFAPTDAAFEKLPSGKLDSLLQPENKEELASLLKYHVVNGRRTVADIEKWSEARTLHGQVAPIASSAGTLTIDGARVVEANIASSNGVMHGIDKVNIPAALSA